MTKSLAIVVAARRADHRHKDTTEDGAFGSPPIYRSISAACRAIAQPGGRFINTPAGCVRLEE
jgi:hypothetical protein